MRTDNRVCHLIEELEQTLVDFIRKHDVTHAEYRRATDLIVASVKSAEESLLFDVFLEAESVDNDNSRQQGTIEAIEGPFYLPDAPILEQPYCLPQRADEDGDALIFSGRVTDTDGNSIADAELDIWQADATGRYSNVRHPTEGPTIPPWNLRGRVTTASDGYFAVRTILPPPYEIPKHGPTGTVFGAKSVVGGFHVFGCLGRCQFGIAGCGTGLGHTQRTAKDSEAQVATREQRWPR